MNEGRALDVTSLGDVAPPDVVRAALRRFRRRIFTTGAVVSLATLSLAGGIVWALVFHRTLGEQVASAPGAAPGLSFTDEGVVTVVERVAKLEDGLAIHLYLAAPGAATGDRYSYSIPGTRYAEDSGSSKVRDYYYVITPPADGIVEATLRLQTGCGAPAGERSCRGNPVTVQTLAIDLTAAGVPGDVWEG